MRIFARAPWYVEGLAFACQQCGQCCAGPEEGYVWVTRQEIDAIANHLGITPAQMHKKHVRMVLRSFSLVEQPGSRDCVFLQADGTGRRRCRIYPVRPVQCRTWPFWATNLTCPEAWAEAGLRCPGVNRGERVPFDTIEVRRLATRE